MNSLRSLGAGHVQETIVTIEKCDEKSLGAVRVEEVLCRSSDGPRRSSGGLKCELAITSTTQHSRAYATHRA